uniref:Putative deddy 3'-5' exonuclease protein n=1 Tax=Nyssomyia neivai TaxID=330878 RepID=A0A1L8DY35_9DIPT
MDFGEFQEGQTVLVQLEKSRLLGEFQRYDPRMKAIHLGNVKDFNTMKYHTRAVAIPQRDILTIHSFSSSSGECKKIKETSNKSIVSIESEKSVILTEEQVQDVQMTICNFEYIMQIDKRYFQAVNEMKDQAMVCGKIAVDVIGGRKGRFAKGSLLILGIPRKIFLVDLMSIGCIPDELKDILVARKPQKIIHDSCALNDYFHSLGITLADVSDTWVAHTSATQTTKHIGVNECVAQHLKLPMTTMTQQEEISFTKRPLDLEQCALAAKQVAFLHHLNDHLQEILLKTYYEACKTYQNGISQHDDPTYVAVRMGSKDFQEWLRKF